MKCLAEDDDDDSMDETVAFSATSQRIGTSAALLEPSLPCSPAVASILGLLCAMVDASKHYVKQLEDCSGLQAIVVRWAP